MKIYGKNSVVERLKANPQSISEIFIEEGIEVSRDIRDICKLHRIPIQRLLKRQFRKITRDIRTQGIIAEIGEFSYFDVEDVLSSAKEKLLTILFLDSLNDPQNLGSILRTSGCFGGFAVILPKYDSVEVTEAVLRVASGGENYVQVAQVNNLSQAIETSKRYGYWIAGAVAGGGQDLKRAQLSFPLGLVIGSEAKGIREGLLKHLDFKLTIPMPHARLSFNAAVAAAIFCYEVTRQRK